MDTSQKCKHELSPWATALPQLVWEKKSGLCHCLLAKSIASFCLYFVLIFPELTFSTSSFLTDLRLARRSKDTLCLEPSSERRIASAETLTLLRLGLLNFPRRSSTLMLRSLIWGEIREKVNGSHLTQEVTAKVCVCTHDACRTTSVGCHHSEICVSLSFRCRLSSVTSLLLCRTLASISYRSSSTASILACSSWHNVCIESKRNSMLKVPCYKNVQVHVLFWVSTTKWLHALMLKNHIIFLMSECSVSVPVSLGNRFLNSPGSFDWSVLAGQSRHFLPVLEALLKAVTG